VPARLACFFVGVTVAGLALWVSDNVDARVGGALVLDPQVAVVVGLRWSLGQLDLVSFDWLGTMPLALGGLAASMDLGLQSWGRAQASAPSTPRSVAFVSAGSRSLST
jgi:hypothetical protein